ncbi:MAG TPA: hypothetical protein VIV12_16750 [Streptosporangiaceae bacterium]
MPDLQGSRLGALLADLAELVYQAKDLEGRIGAVKALSKPLIEGQEATLCAAGIGTVRWQAPNTELTRLDRKKLVTVLHLTPDQIKAVEVPAPRAGSVTFTLDSAYAPPES